MKFVIQGILLGGGAGAIITSIVLTLMGDTEMSSLFVLMGFAFLVINLYVDKLE